MKENKEVFTEEQLKTIHEIYDNSKYYDMVMVVSFSVFVVLVAVCFVFWLNTSRHNSDVDYQNKQLSFCKDIYESDHVVLEQCKDYFVILGEDGNV